MVIQTLKFLIPHFITRCLILDEQRNLLGVFHGQRVGDQLAIEDTGFLLAEESNNFVDISLGISWFGYAIFFWVKESYERAKPQT